MNSFVIDAFEFCRRKEQREGKFPVADLTRLAADCADTSGTIEWSLTGSVNQFDHEQFTLSVNGVVMLKCQRCMEAFAFDLDVRSILILAKNDEQADEIEELIDDDSIDVIVGAKSFDIVALIEDETLLALPQSPRHEICPDASLVESVGKQVKDSPFSRLKEIKK